MKKESSSSIVWATLALLAAVALYIIAYMPACAYFMRHPRHKELLRPLWSPLPRTTRYQLFWIWEHFEVGEYRYHMGPPI